VAVRIAHIGAVGGGAGLGAGAGGAFATAAIGQGLGVEDNHGGAVGGAKTDGAAIGVGGGLTVDGLGDHEFGHVLAVHGRGGAPLGEALDAEGAQGRVVEGPGSVDIIGAHDDVIEDGHARYSCPLILWVG